MTRRSLSPRQTARARRAAFTLIELLTVIAIILVLAGLLLHVAGSANRKSSEARAKAEIQAMSAALESYKADYGAYPRSSVNSGDADTFTDKLNAQTDVDPGGGDKTTYQGAGKTLYMALSGTTVANGSLKLTKPYMSFLPGQLSTGNAAITSIAQIPYIIDPFGVPYGYSTAQQASLETAQATSSSATPDPGKGYNPTFDLWSTAGYSKTGALAYPSGIAKQQLVWLTNW